MKKFLMVMVLGLFFISIGSASAGDTPASLNGATVMDAAKAKSLQDGGAKMIDTRVANEYAEAHIKGAVSVPYKEKSAKSPDYDASQDDVAGFLSKLEKAAGKGDKVIFYCNGPECWKSYKGAHEAIKGGYKNVFWFRGGFPEWKSKGLPTE